MRILTRRFLDYVGHGVNDIYWFVLPVILPFLRVAPIEPDLVLEEDGLSLKDYGIAGKVLHTPGHSPGSMSGLLDTEDVFVGDMAMNGFPFCRKPSLPIFADDPAQGIHSLKSIGKPVE